MPDNVAEEKNTIPTFTRSEALGLGGFFATVESIANWQGPRLSHSTVIGLGSFACAWVASNFSIEQSGLIAGATWAMTTLAVGFSYKISSAATEFAAALGYARKASDEDWKSEAYQNSSLKSAAFIGNLAGCTAAAIVGIPTLLWSYNHAAKEFSQPSPHQQSQAQPSDRAVAFRQEGNKVIAAVL